MQLYFLIPNPGQHSCTMSGLVWAHPWKPEGETDGRKESGALDTLIDLIKEELTLWIFVLIFLNYNTSNSTSCTSLPCVISLITIVCFCYFLPHSYLDGNGRELGTHRIFCCVNILLFYLQQEAISNLIWTLDSLFLVPSMQLTSMKMQKAWVVLKIHSDLRIFFRLLDYNQGESVQLILVRISSLWRNANHLRKTLRSNWTDRKAF